MKLIEQSAELWQQGWKEDDIWNHIARCTRVCYQSVPKSDKENGKDFCERTILKNKHYAMLEHGTVYLCLDDERDARFFINNPYSEVVKSFERKYYITTNMRVLVEQEILDILDCACEPTNYHPKRYTISCVTSIGVTREFNRHRVHSIAEQSTRYCNFSKDKFGNELTFIKPYFYDYLSPVARQYFDKTLLNDEKAYIQMCNFNCSAQESRELLPLCTKSQLVHTAFDNDWKTFIDIRLYGLLGKPHPNMRDLAALIEKELRKTDSLYFIEPKTP